jgi:hypothetical protein
MLKKTKSKKEPPFAKINKELYCPNCHSKFVEAEEKHILKPTCSHFPKNIRVAFV